MGAIPRVARGFRPGFFPNSLLAMYVLAVALVPLSHHDVVCHIKSSTHCTTCVTGSTAESTSHVAALGATPLSDAGRATSNQVNLTFSAPLSASSGRSPPLS
jgi:hypothetical protein